MNLEQYEKDCPIKAGSFCCEHCSQVTLLSIPALSKINVNYLFTDCWPAGNRPHLSLLPHGAQLRSFRVSDSLTWSSSKDSFQQHYSLSQSTGQQVRQQITRSGIQKKMESTGLH